MKKRFVSVLLVLALALGLAVPSLAAGPSFTDVPESYWGYADIEAVAQAGYMNGTGNGAFSPEMKVSVAQFLTLLGRLVFPDVKAEGNDWFGPYVSAAQEAGLLAGSQVDVNNVQTEISRYDMAVILRAAAKKLGVAEKSAQQSEVADYLDTPARYVDAVLAVYGMGLIKGDQAGNFNGSNTMMRAEVATVIMRLAKAKPGGNSQGGGTDPQPTVGPEQPKDATYHLQLVGNVVGEGTLVLGERTRLSCAAIRNTEDTAGAPYGQDRSGFSCSSSNPSIVQTEFNSDNWSWSITALALGSATVTIADPYGVSASLDITVVAEREGIGTMAYTVCVRPACYEEHNIRGNAYTRTTTVPDVAYKLYHTRDGGKTAQLVYEGVAPSEGGSGTLLEVELPEDAFFSKDAGFYISAEAVVEGQRMVTSDLRTDGRAHVTLVQNIWPTLFAGDIFDTYEMEIKLTPPQGEKAHFTFTGYVKQGNGDGKISGATVQLYHRDGALVGETVSRADGTFEMECEVDALDGGFDKRKEQYRVAAWGYDDLGYWGFDGFRTDGSQVLESLVDLQVAPSLDRDGPGDGNYRVILYPGINNRNVK